MLAPCSSSIARHSAPRHYGAVAMQMNSMTLIYLNHKRRMGERDSRALGQREMPQQQYNQMKRTAAFAGAVAGAAGSRANRADVEAVAAPVIAIEGCCGRLTATGSKDGSACGFRLLGVYVAYIAGLCTGWHQVEAVSDALAQQVG